MPGTDAISMRVYSCCGRRSTSSRGPSSTSSPWRSTATRCAISATTPKSWVMKSTPVPWRACSSAIELQDLRLRGDVERGGRLVGDQERRLEHERHRDHDPLALAAGELVRIRVDDPRGIGQVHLADDVEDLRAPRRGVERRVLDQHLVDLLAAAHDRVERGHRLLEDHRHPGRAELAQPARRCARQVVAVEPDRAAGDRQRLRQQAHHALRDHRLARARLADEADDLAASDVERHARHGFRPIGSRRERDREVPDLEHRGAHSRRAMRGSSVSRRPSPRMFTASTVTARKMPGKNTLCG